MQKTKFLSNNVCLSFVTKSLEDFECEELRIKLRELYESKNKNERFLATILNAIFTGKRAYFGISRQLFTKLLSADPNIKANTISGSDFKQVLNLELKKYCSMTIGFSTAHKTPAIWELDGGSFGEIFRRTNPTISKEEQLSECKKFVDPNSTTYLTVEEISTEREKEKEKEVDISPSSKPNQKQKNHFYSNTALEQASDDDWYKGFLNWNCIPAINEYEQDEEKKDHRYYFGYYRYQFRKGYIKDIDIFTTCEYMTKTDLLIDAAIEKHNSDWKSVLIILFDHFYNNGWILKEIYDSIKNVIYKRLTPLLISINTNFDESKARFEINRFINLIVTDKIESFCSWTYDLQEIKQLYWLGLDEQ